MSAAARLRRLVAAAATNRRGTTVIEFAIIAPVMMMVIMGLGDLLYQTYVQSLLTGAMQKAARDSAIQGGAQNTAALDAKVIAMVGSIVKNPTQSCAAATSTTAATASWCSSRASYSSFQSIKPEAFTDSNGNGKRDPGECFTDINGNGTWDADPGLAGQGGANDVALYTMSLTYPRIFPVMGLIGLPATQTITSTTLLKNQPYATQNVPTPATICT